MLHTSTLAASMLCLLLTSTVALSCEPIGGMFSQQGIDLSVAEHSPAPLFLDSTLGVGLARKSDEPPIISVSLTIDSTSSLLKLILIDENLKQVRKSSHPVTCLGDRWSYTIQHGPGGSEGSWNAITHTVQVALTRDGNLEITGIRHVTSGMLFKTQSTTVEFGQFARMDTYDTNRKPVTTFGY